MNTPQAVKVTLEQIRDGLRTNADDLERMDELPMLATHLRNMADATDTNIANLHRLTDDLKEANALLRYVSATAGKRYDIGDKVMVSRWLFVHGRPPNNPCVVEAIHETERGVLYDVACTGDERGVHLESLITPELSNEICPEV